MIEQGLFKRHFVGRDGFIWWIGQIASEESWKDNIPGVPVGSNDDIQGFGERYRVRIMGYHTADINKIADDELPWGYVMYPTTAGTGGRSGGQSANLSQGDFVFGFFLDGEDAQTPIIIGCLGNNDYAAVSKNIPPARFVPFSGFQPNDYVPHYSQRTERGGTVITQDGPQVVVGKSQAQGDKTETPNNQQITESQNASNSLKESASQAASEEQTQPLALPSDCEPMPVGRIQKEIQNIIVEIQKIQKSIYTYNRAVQNQVSDIQNKINNLIDKGTKFIASGIKWIFTQIQKFVLNKVNNVLKNTYFLIFPNERPGLKLAIENINDLIACLFRKFINLLISQIGNFLKDAASRVINGARCFVENVIGQTLGQIIKLVSDIINSSLSGIISLVGQAASIAGDILGILTDILSFLSCEEKPQCSSIDEWNILSGGNKTGRSDINSIIGKAKNFASGFQNVIDPENFSFDTNFDGVFDQSGCDIGPVFCGPPSSNFFGSGVGAAGNIIIGSAGEVLGVDMISFGFGYDSSRTYGKVFDNCGKGSGSVITPVIGEVEVVDENDPQPSTNLPTVVDPTGEIPPGTITTGVVDVDVIEPGTGYLPAPDGSRGGNEYTWADPEDTILKHPDGSYETPTPPGNILVVNPGDIITLPPGTSVITEPQLGGESITQPTDTSTGETPSLIGGNTYLNPLQPGNDLEVIGGQGDTESTSGQGGGETIFGGNPYTILRPGIITTPAPDYSRQSGNYPTSSTGSYPVILYLDDIKIIESGINYADGDKIIIEPSLGATAEPKFDSQGRVTSIKVTQPGEGFTVFPNIYIQSETGYNAVLRPKFFIDRIGNDKLKEPTFQDKVVTVIDCVGKF